MAGSMGIAQRTYASYERDERLPDAEALAYLVDAGWNANWLLTGEGPERLDQLVTASTPASQPVKQETLKLALQLASEALEEKGLTLSTPDRAELVTIIYDLLEEGLPEAKVLSFAKRVAA